MKVNPVHCIDCEHFNLRASKAMAEQGYGHCSLGPIGKFQSAVFDRTCQSFKAVDRDTSAKRRQWLDEQRVAFRKSILGENT